MKTVKTDNFMAESPDCQEEVSAMPPQAKQDQLEENGHAEPDLIATLDTDTLAMIFFCEIVELL